MNKKLIKRIVVANLACFIIANFINIHSYSKTLVTPELCDKKLEEVKKAYENDEDVKKWTDYLDRVKKGEKISYTYTTAKTNEEKTITLTVKFCEEKLQDVKEIAKERYDGDVEYWTDLKNQVLTQDASTKTYISDSEEEVEADKIKAATNQDLNSHIDIKSYEGNIVSYTKAIENAKKAIEKYKSQGYVEDSKMIQNKLKEIEKYEKDIELKKQAIQNEKNKEILRKEKKESQTSQKPTEQEVKGTYVETIKSYQESLKAHKEYLEEAKKSGDAALIKNYEDNIQDDLNKIEIYSLMQQYIIEEDPNTNQELLKKWNLTKLTGDDRYLYYNKPSPLKIADGFEIYEDKTEFNCYYDDIVVDANGKRNRVYCLHGKDKNVKTNLDPNRYVVENIGLLQYDIYDKNPIYTITHVRDDKNLIFNGWPAPSRLEEDNQVFEFKYNCPFGVPINGRINFFVTFDPRSIRQYTLKKIFDGKLKSEWKDDYILYSLTGGIRTHYSVDSKMKDDDRERYQQGDNTFTICNTTRRNQLLNGGGEKYYDSINADNIKIKEIKFMIDSYYKNFHGVLDSN